MYRGSGNGGLSGGDTQEKLDAPGRKRFIRNIRKKKQGMGLFASIGISTGVLGFKRKASG